MPRDDIGLLEKIRIRGFKSILDLELQLGRVNVFVGENGSGKSNILEAITFVAAASADKLDHEFLASRGMRTPPASAVLSAFPDAPDRAEIVVSGPGRARFEFLPAQSPGPHQWKTLAYIGPQAEQPAWEHPAAISLLPSGSVNYTLDSNLEKSLWDSRSTSDPPKSLSFLGAGFKALRLEQVGHLEQFLLYAPETSALRTFQSETQIRPLGTSGEGLFAHLQMLRSTQEGQKVLEALNENLRLLNWFKSFELPENLGPGERRMDLRDRFLTKEALLDTRSANEGFLYLLFYFTLFLSPSTPRFFAIDNIDASLNPRLCRYLVRELVRLAKVNQRQVLLTTHNPAALDGLDLSDDEQRLFVVYRDSNGATRARRVPEPRRIEGAPDHPLSEAFMRGYLGGLPENF